MRDRDEGTGGIPQPFVPGSPTPHRSTPREGGLAPPFIPGAAFEPPPDVITDQVAGLSPLAAELPSINEFLYDEAPAAEMPPARPTPTPQPRQTPARGSVPPLPGFSPSRGMPAGDYEEPTYQPAATPAAPYQQHATPAATAPMAPDWTPARPTPAQPSHITPAQPTRPAPSQPVAKPGESWATGEWQHYDWRSAASLAPEERARAAQAWADLDWESESTHRVRERNESVAAALERLARRVRAGDLLVHGSPGMTEEAAAAAALAALLARRT